LFILVFSLEQNILIPAGYDETLEMQKHSHVPTLLDRIKNGSLVTIGMCGTGGVLAYGIYTFRKGRPSDTAKFMGMRVMVQGATVAAFMGYGLYAYFSGNNNHHNNHNHNYNHVHSKHARLPPHPTETKKDE